MITTSNYTGPKDIYLADRLLGPMWDNRDQLRPTRNDTLESFFNRLTSITGVGTFTAGQVVADVKYTAVLRDASDWWTWAAPGPGSRRGLNRVLGRHHEQSWPGKSWHNALGELVNWLGKQGEVHHAQDVQNCLCEFDKYERVRLGQGKAKQRYVIGVVRDA